jgi:hypothetical protein
MRQARLLEVELVLDPPLSLGRDLAAPPQVGKPLALCRN